MNYLKSLFSGGQAPEPADDAQALPYDGELMLYHRPNCPFCHRVYQYLNQAKITVPERNLLSDANARDDLIRIGGKAQVPCLVIDGEALYESLDIINWLENQRKSGSKGS